VPRVGDTRAVRGGRRARVVWTRSWLRGWLSLAVERDERG
jgi:hypothetical protein